MKGKKGRKRELGDARRDEGWLIGKGRGCALLMGEREKIKFDIWFDFYSRL